MTVYSQHANRGKVQVLATYHGPNGVVASTITSVENAALAAPIVDALNRISATATVPISVWDERDGELSSYPAEHLAALTERNARPSLLHTSHSLWYAQVMVFLHQALCDLDRAVLDVPTPGAKAVEAELQAEKSALQDELAEYQGELSSRSVEHLRHWRFGAPFVALTDSPSWHEWEDRRNLNRLEQKLDRAEREEVIADIRLLMDVVANCTNTEVQLLTDGLEISDDPFDEDWGAYYLNVAAPDPTGGGDRARWSVELNRWIPDKRDPSHATGERVLVCACTERPASSQLVELLNRSNGDPAVLAAWAQTRAGELLPGTAFIVTERYEA